MKGPSDGYAYNRIELNAIWELPVAFETILDSLQKRWEFFTKCSGLEKNPEKEDDKARAERIVKALIAERYDPAPPKDG